MYGPSPYHYQFSPPQQSNPVKTILVILLIASVVAAILFMMESTESTEQSTGSPGQPVIPLNNIAVGVGTKVGVEKDINGTEAEVLTQINEIKAKNQYTLKQEISNKANTYKIFKGKNCFGPDYAVQVDMGNATLEGCKQRCTGMKENCTGFVMNMNQNRCFMFKNDKFVNANACRGDGKYQTFAKK